MSGGARVLVRVAVWVVVLGAAAGTGVLAYRRLHSQRTTVAPQYYTVPASIGPVTLDVSGSGTVQPVQTASVSAPVAGAVAVVDVKVGQRVAAGQVLYRLNDTTGLAAQLQSAQAQLASAQAQLADDEDPAANVSTTTVANDEARVQQDQDTLTQDQATLVQAQENASQDGRVTAPESGTIMAVDTRPGDPVSAGATLATLLPSSTPEVTVAVPEEDLTYLPVGTLATVVLPMQASAQASVTAVGLLPAGSVTVNADGAVTGTSAGGRGGSSMIESEYDLTLTFTQSPGNVPQGEAVQVAFQPQGDPPSSYPWTFAGSMIVPATMDLTAPAAGTVTTLPTVGEQVSSGQTVATIDDASAQQTVQNDLLRVQEDETSLSAAKLQLAQDAHPTAASATTIQTARAQLASDTVAVQRAQQNLQGLTVTAPFAGEVTALDITPGQTLQAGAVGLTLDSTALEVSLPVDELDIGQVRVGQHVRLDVSAFPGTTYTGTVTAISPVPTSSGGATTYPVTVTLNATQGLQEGMSATAAIAISSVASTLRVPAQAVTLAAGSANRGVLRVLQNGVPVSRSVRVGLVGTDYDQILSGLQVGQLVIAGQATTAGAATAAGPGRAAFALRGARAFTTGGLGGGGFGGGGFGGAGFTRGG